jgi:CheY-like chemotaxis protein
MEGYGRKMFLNILLVDDNDINLKIASLMLKKLGHKAGIATNGIEAIEALEHQSYDIVLMDIQMPEMNGLEATRIIRQRWDKRIKIIFITSIADNCEACLEVGADDFLTKPLRIEELRDSIQCCMPIPLLNGCASSGIKEFAATPNLLVH